MYDPSMQAHAQAHVPPMAPPMAPPTAPPMAPPMAPQMAGAPPPPAPAMPLFGVVIAGRPVITDFAPVSEGRCVATVPSPADVAEVSFFLLPHSPVPPTHGAVLHYTADGAHWQPLGAVTHAKPSGIFRTGWAMQQAMRASAAIQLGVALEPLESVRNLELADGAGHERRWLAQKIARDLYKFAASFATGGGGATLTVPANFVERWIEKFEAKCRVDPGFMMKNDD